MNVTVIRLREDARDHEHPGKSVLLPVYEEALALLLRFAAEAGAYFVHIELEPNPTLSLWRCVDGEDEAVDVPAELPADFCWELIRLAKSDFSDIGEHFKETATEVGSPYSPVLLVEVRNAKSYWNRTWTDSLLQFQSVT